MNLLFYQFEINRSRLVFLKHTHNYVGFPICHSYSSMPLAPYSRFVFQTKDFRIKAGDNYINIETSILTCLSCTIASLFPHPWPGLFVLNIVIKNSFQLNAVWPFRPEKALYGGVSRELRSLSNSREDPSYFMSR